MSSFCFLGTRHFGSEKQKLRAQIRRTVLQICALTLAAIDIELYLGFVKTRLA
jgi:hypothetical protein